MKETTTTINIEAEAISDRGLNEKRPINEDSFLSDTKRRIFAVADGVGGAQAGEVASQTAMEVLDEAFRHQVDGADIEDLMEVAIQRANASIHRMAREHPKFAMMATTVVALHLDGHIATIGHVGDSRLYRLTPDGKLQRETKDHSVVEEEVRAGRMTPDQAAHHPSRNVISRALGAEESVEVDLKTIEVEDGTCFLLCSDGITRHLADDEIHELLTSQQSLDAICAEMKRRCYERGAEDNLTAVIVRVGAPGLEAAVGFDGDDERTILATRPASALPDAGEITPSPAPDANDASTEQSVSRAVIQVPTTPAPEAESESSNTSARAETPATSSSRRRSSSSAAGSIGRAFVFLLLLAGVAAAAFYGGMYYQRQQPEPAATNVASIPKPSPVADDPAAKFDKNLRAVDQAPASWMANELKAELSRQGIANPLDSNDPELLYLYGRALMVSGGDAMQAHEAFSKAMDKLDGSASTNRPPLKAEALFARVAAALKARNRAAVERAATALDGLAQKSDATSTTTQSGTGGTADSSPTSGGVASPATSQQ